MKGKIDRRISMKVGFGFGRLARRDQMDLILQ